MEDICSSEVPNIKSKESKMNVKRIVMLAAVLSLVAGTAVFSEPVSEDTAMRLVNNWLISEQMSGYTAKSAQAVTAEDGTILHYIVKCAPKGFVIIAPDTRMEPIIAFSQADNARPDNPLFNIARQDTTTRRKLDRKSVV